MRRSLLLVAILVASGCSSLLGLDDFEDAPGTTGGGSGGGATGGAPGGGGPSGGGASGGGGAPGGGGASGGGGAPTGGAGGDAAPDGPVKFKCTAAAPSGMFTTVDPISGDGDPRVLVVTENAAAVIVGSYATASEAGPTPGSLLLIRLKENSGNISQGAQVTLSETDLGGKHFMPLDAAIANGKLYLFGKANVGPAMVSVDATTFANPVITERPNPCVLDGGGVLKRAVFDTTALTGDPPDPPYVVVCDDYNFYACPNATGTCDHVKCTAKDECNVSHYVAGLMASEFGSLYWKDGTSWKSGKPALPAGSLVFGMGLAPRYGGGAIVLEGAADPVTIVGKAYAASVEPTAYAQLGTATPYKEMTSLTSMDLAWLRGATNQWWVTPSGIGKYADSSQLNLWVMSADLKSVAKTTLLPAEDSASVRYLTVSAAPMGLTGTIAAWWEENGTTYSLHRTLVNCMPE